MANKLPQLFLLHFSGGNIYSYNFLRKHLSTFFEMVPLELPGRGKRMSEKLIKERLISLKDLKSEFYKYKKCDVPFMIYGHSMGAILGFELIQSLITDDHKPVCFVPTGNPGPNIAYDEIRYNLSSIAFKKSLIELGGIPDEIINNCELFNFFEPILRADFEILEKNNTSLLSKINCPIYCAMGSFEKRTEDISNWEKYTTSKFKYEIFTGNHFFINEHPEKLAEFILKAYNESLVF